MVAFELGPQDESLARKKNVFKAIMFYALS